MFYDSLTIEELEKLVHRFTAKIVKENCWKWESALNKGYGVFSIKNKTKQAHRLSFELFSGRIPKGLQLDHLCRNPKCVNPSHLEPVTPKENMNRSMSVAYQRNKTECRNGHSYSAENTVINKRGARECLTCTRKSKRMYETRQRALRKAMA